MSAIRRDRGRGRYRAAQSTVSGGATTIVCPMETVGLEVLRRHVFDYVRRAETGESILITVAGRPSALLGPVASRRQWPSARAVAQLFGSPRDVTWEADVAAVADNLQDPWKR